MDRNIEKTVLSNGLTVISEAIPTVQSISIGVWIKAGSRYETPENNGIAHFIEHLVFKGSKTRSGLQLARALEDLGGSLNAYTSKELTHFYAYALHNHLSTCVKILADLVCNPLFKETDIEKEKLVVLEEINAVKDTPDEYLYDVFQERLFPQDPIGFPILGTPETVNAFTRKQVLEFWERYYTPQNMIVSAAGRLNHQQFVKQVERYFHFSGKGASTTFRKPEPTLNLRLKLREPFNQAHIIAGTEGVPFTSEERYAMLALNAYLGGGMSSRLFQTVRERHGLAYTVYSSIDFFSDTGIFSVYMGTDRNKQERALDLLFKEIRKVAEKTIARRAMQRLREQLKGQLLLGLESTSRRMARLAKNEIYFGRQLPLNEMLEQIEGLDEQKIQSVAQKHLDVDKFNIIQMSSDA